MNLSLIFPPLMSPSCVPAGIAYLKSYIDTYAGGVNVNLIDLNLSLTNRLLDGHPGSLIDICGKAGISCRRRNNGCRFKNKLSPQETDIFNKAKCIIKDKRLFLDKVIFEKYVIDCYDYLEEVNTCIARILKSCVEKSLPADEAAAEHILNEELAKIKSTLPEVAGFSILLEGQIVYALALAKIVKRKLGIPVVLGGPALFKYDLKEFMAAFDFVDFIVLKEGEESLLELIKNIDSGDYESVPNLIWRKDGKITANRIKCLDDLNRLPAPDFTGLELGEYFHPELILPVQSSRGCPWQRCKFCALNVQYDRLYRQKNIERIVEEISFLKEKYGASNFFFLDSEIPSYRLKRLSALLIDRRLNISFAGYLRPAKGLNLDTLKIARRAGGRFFILGVETFSGRGLRSIDKGTTLGSIMNVLKNACQLRIGILVYMMAGFPSQTVKELRQDLKKVVISQKRYRIFSVIYSLYRMDVYQKFYEELKGHGLKTRMRKAYFTNAKGLKVTGTDFLNFSCRETSARAYFTGGGHEDEFKLNEDRENFIRCVNNFLFETQLIYCKWQGKYSRNTDEISRLNSFYREKKADMVLNSYAAARPLGHEAA